MTNGKHGGGVGALAFVRQVRGFRHITLRMMVSVRTAVLVVMATLVFAVASTVSPAVKLSADSTALIMGGTAVPTPDPAYIETVKNHYIAPTHPGQDIHYVAVTTPEEFWPITGIGRLAASVVGAPSIWGPGGPAWPDEPWWKLSGLFDLTIDQSIQAGVADLETAMAANGNDHLVIYGYSQGAVVANVEKQKLSAQYPAGTKAPDIDFVLSGDLNVPNGGLHARFPGLYVPILDWSFNGADPTNTPFDTTVITRQYDGLADFPLYPLDVIADLNAVLGIAYVHLNELDVSLPADPTTSPAYQGTHGDTSYYFFDTKKLPLFDPLRTLGVPESVIDVVQPFFRVLVELGYDRSIPPWEPTPARLIPTTFDLAKVTTDLVNAVGEGINNALALVGPRSSPSSPTPSRSPALMVPKAGISGPVSTSGTVAQPPLTESTAPATFKSFAMRRPLAQHKPTALSELTSLKPASTDATATHYSVASVKPAVQKIPSISVPKGSNAREPSVGPKQSLSTVALTPTKASKPANRWTAHRPVGESTHDVAERHP
jgi:hypothetical protein